MIVRYGVCCTVSVTVAVRAASTILKRCTLLQIMVCMACIVYSESDTLQCVGNSFVTSRE